MVARDEVTAHKIKTILLAHDLSAQTYQVVKITDSVLHPPGTFLDVPTVEGLCAADDWKVTVQKEK